MTLLNWRVSRSIRLIDALKEKAGSSFSARYLKRMLEANGCRVNDAIERFGSVVLQKGDRIELSSHWASLEKKRPLSVSILYEDEELLVIDKPAGVECKDEVFQRELKRPVWLAHRLDKDTTGVLLFGKTGSIAKELQNSFERRDVSKEYLALVDGQVKKESGVIQNHLAKKGSFQGQTIWGSANRGFLAVTHWKLIDSNSNATLLLCKPVTGRTHQIRVHLSEMGHPILIDRQYASRFRSHIAVSRPLLHAFRVQLKWKERSLTFIAPIALDFQEVLKQCHFHWETL